MIDVPVPLNKENREDTWMRIRGLEECTGLRWVVIDIGGYPSGRVDIDKCVEDMRGLFEQVAMKCQPEKGFHVNMVKKYPGSDGTDINRTEVQGAWGRYGRDNDGNFGKSLREILDETDSRFEADERLRKRQDDYSL